MILRSLLLLGALLTGCDSDCSLPAQVDEIIDGAPVRECGELPTQMGGSAPYEDSRACVLAAVAAKAPFEVHWTVGDDEGHALIGIYSDGYQLQRIDTLGASAKRFSCRAITDLGACGDVFTTLCLECTDASETDSCD